MHQYTLKSPPPPAPQYPSYRIPIGTLINRNAEQALLKAEIEQLKDTLQSIREEREQEEAKSGAKQNQDATVRRLDNERQYLKSQLASEVTLKNELQEALFVCQTKLSETQKRWHEDVEEVKETAAKASQDAGFAHQVSEPPVVSYS